MIAFWTAVGVAVILMIVWLALRAVARASERASTLHDDPDDPDVQGDTHGRGDAA